MLEDASQNLFPFLVESFIPKAVKDPRSLGSYGSNLEKIVIAYGFDSSTSEDELYSYFTQFGEVIEIKLSDYGEMIVASVTYRLQSEAEDAIEGSQLFNF